VRVPLFCNAVVLLPQDNPWQTLFDALAEFPADTCLVRDQPAIEERTPVG
jgi:antitoxin VapB